MGVFLRAENTLSGIFGVRAFDAIAVRDRPGPSSADAPQPDIVLIMADDLGYGGLGICGLRPVSERAHDGPAYRPHACLGQYVRQARRRRPRTRTLRDAALSRSLRARAGTCADASKRICPRMGQILDIDFAGEKIYLLLRA